MASLSMLLVVSASAAAAQPRNHELLNSTLWAQTAVEHDAVCLQAYRQARGSLDRALKQKSWTAALEQQAGRGARRLPPAVILDIDETVLDNAAMQARTARADTEFQPAAWDQWVEESAATPLPGALEFTRYAHSRGVTVFYVTNRDAKHERATRANLERLGFPVEAARGPATDTLLTRGEKPDWGSDKGSRRTAVAESYRVLLLVGDDFGDFVSGARSSLAERRAIAERHSERWGVSWIMLPNAMYGSWETALFEHDMRGGREDRLRKKFEQLQPRHVR